MSNNKYYLEIINQIIDIQNNIFEINTLRTALEITNKASFYFNQNKVSKKELNNINNFLKETIERKFIELNPNLSKSTLNKICKCYNREYICLPNDITIINDNIVFYQERNYGNPYDTHTILLNDNSKNKFTKITKTDIINPKNLTTANQLITYINTTLKPFFKKESPILSLKNNTIVFNNYIKIYTTPNINETLENINTKKNTTINLLVLGDWNEIYYFQINTNFNNRKNSNWSWKLLKPGIWNLTEELEKRNQSTKTLKRKKI